MAAPALLLGMVKKRAALKLAGAAFSAMVLCCVMALCGSIALMAFGAQSSTAACTTVATGGAGQAVTIAVPDLAPIRLSQSQVTVAQAYIAVGRARSVPDNGIVIALMMALQESNMQMLANSSVPDSLQYPHDGVGSDHDSVGSAQQRPSAGWGVSRSSCNPPTTLKPSMVGHRGPTMDRLEGFLMSRDGIKWTRVRQLKRFKGLLSQKDTPSGSQARKPL
ncbi:hypothetical protein NHF46_00205 [Arthrobacter alpinus]|nr:hypothetical protein [Arthrobacter alpinus]